MTSEPAEVPHPLPSPVDTGTLRYVARQPIVDRERRVVGYELLFREHDGPLRAVPDADRATARVITDGVFSIGLDTLVGDRLAFINIGRDLLLDGIPTVLPAPRVVLELGADVEADAPTLAACRELRQAGYVLALDDFVLTPDTEDLLPLVSYAKVDMQFASTPAGRRRIGAVASPGGPLLVAKRVETPDQFLAARDEGFACFQGFFLGHPVIEAGRSIGGADLGRLQLLSALQNPMLSLTGLEELVKPDAALCYQILRTVNSVAYAQSRRVQSVRQALILLGRDIVRRWVSVWTLAGLGERAHPELIWMSAVRARCCEVLGGLAGDHVLAAEAYLVGLCSMLDTILGRPMVEVLADVPLAPVVRAALLGEDVSLRWLLDATVAYERGDFDTAAAFAARAGLHPSDVAPAHLDALRWMRELKKR